jgi:hypothetical protein
MVISLKTGEREIKFFSQKSLTSKVECAMIILSCTYYKEKEFSLCLGGINAYD